MQGRRFNGVREGEGGGEVLFLSNNLWKIEARDFRKEDKDKPKHLLAALAIGAQKIHSTLIY